MRYRAGNWGLSGIIVGGIGAPVMLGLAVFVVWRMTADPGDIGWLLIGLVGALFFVLVTVGWFGTGLSSLRPIRLEPGTLSLPEFDLRRGLHRVVLPLDDVVDVHLEHYFEYHNSRWRLAVERRGLPVVECDSINSSRTSKKGIAGTRAARATDELRAAIFAAQGRG